MQLRIQICSGFLLWFLLPCIGYAGSQNSFELGYLVLDSGDTLSGLLKLKGNYIGFKIAEAEKTQKIPISNIVAYSYLSDSLERHKFDGVFYFLDLKGPVSLYTRSEYIHTYNGQFTQTIHQMTYGVNRQGELKLTKLYITSTLGRGKSYFKKTASEYFKDCAEIVEEIEAGVYKKPKEIEVLVARYNEWFLKNNSKSPGPHE